MSSREQILADLRVNRPRVERPLPQVPLFDEPRPASLLSTFKENLERMGGLFIDPAGSGDPLGPVRQRLAQAKVVCSTVPQIGGNRDITQIRTSQDVADVDLAVVRAAFAVAETGSVLLGDAQLRFNAVGYLAQHLLVLLDPADIVINLHHAYQRPEFRNQHIAE